MPAISIPTRMLPVPIIDGSGAHTRMSKSARTGDATETGLSIPMGLDGIGNCRGVRTGKLGRANKGRSMYQHLSLVEVGVYIHA